jgi:hypothetical protein
MLSSITTTPCVTRDFGDRLANVLEVMRGDPAGDGIEAPILERQLFRP